jgi:hypothetical protein
VNGSLLVEIWGRSLKLKGYDADKKQLRRLNRALIADKLEADRLGITPKQRELRAFKIIDEIMSSDNDKKVAKDIKAQLKLVEKHLVN